MEFSKTNLPFPTDTELSAIIIALGNQPGDYIADKVLPRVPGNSSNKLVRYQEFAHAGTLTVPDTEVGRKGVPDEVDFGGEEKSVVAKDFGLQALIPAEDIIAARSNPSYDPEKRAVEGIGHLLMLDREVRVANFVKDATNYESGNVLTLSGNKQLSHADSDPAAALWAAIEKPRVRPNLMVMGAQVWNVLRRNAKLIQEVRRSTDAAGALGRHEFAAHFEVEFAIGNAHINTNRPGKKMALGRAWDKIIHLSYKAPLSLTGETMTWGVTFEAQGKVAGRVETPNVGLRGGVVVKAGESLAEVAVAPWAGYLIKAAVA